MSPTTRKILLPLHLWAGLSVGIILLVVSITGVLLVYRTQLERRFDSHKFIVDSGPARLGIDDLIGRARAAHPVGDVTSFRYYEDATQPFIVLFSNNDYIHLNPHTGKVLGMRPRYGSLFGWVEGMHKFLQLPPSIGENITGYTAVVFFFIILSGIVLWWPATRRALQAGLTFNRKLSGRPWNLNLHKTIGIYAASMLLVSVSTGVPMALDWAKAGLYVLTGSKETPVPKVDTKEKSFAGYNAIARNIAQAYPTAGETYIAAPKKGVVSAFTILDGASHPNARSYILLEASTGKVLQVIPYTDAPAGQRLYYWGMSLHTGRIGGPVVPLMLMLGALCVPVLAFTGTASYLRRRAGRAATSAAKAAPVSSPIRS